MTEAEHPPIDRLDTGPADLTLAPALTGPFLRSVLNASHDCIKLVGLDGALLYMNANGQTAMEIEDFLPLCGMPWPELWPEDTRQTIQDAIKACRNGQAVRFEAFCPTAKGMPKWWDVSVSPILDANNAVSQILSISRDITDRKMTELAFADREVKSLEDAERWKQIVNSIDEMIWSTRPDGFHDFYNTRWYEYTGVPEGSTDGEGWSGMFHPEDQERAWDVWRHSLETGEPYRIEYRLRHKSGEYRWVLGRARCVRDSQGQITRWYGTCIDIHDLKQAQAAQELLTGELSHRIKNIFALVSSLISLSAREYPQASQYVLSLKERIGALMTAHLYISHPDPKAEDVDRPLTLHGLLRLLVAPYMHDNRGRILIEGDDIALGQKSATALALAIHELATNATKYGALSVEGGTVRILCEQNGPEYRLIWRERGGPAVSGPPEKTGFGTFLAERLVSAQLGATGVRDWAQEGLTFTLAVPTDGLWH